MNPPEKICHQVKCSMCDRAFPSLNFLIEHIVASHSGEKTQSTRKDDTATKAPIQHSSNVDEHNAERNESSAKTTIKSEDHSSNDGDMKLPYLHLTVQRQVQLGIHINELNLYQTTSTASEDSITESIPCSTDNDGGDEDVGEDISTHEVSHLKHSNDSPPGGIVYKVESLRRISNVIQQTDFKQKHFKPQKNNISKESISTESSHTLENYKIESNKHGLNNHVVPEAVSFENMAVQTSSDMELEEHDRILTEQTNAARTPMCTHTIGPRTGENYESSTDDDTLHTIQGPTEGDIAVKLDAFTKQGPQSNDRGDGAKSTTEFGPFKDNAHVNKPYACSVCDKAFLRNSQLKRHKRVHTGEKPYMCDSCGSSFSQSGALSRHLRIHTGERPHGCDECGMAFISSFELERHERTHTGARPYTCGICNKSFSLSGNLSKHMVVHTGERPYACEVCGKSFSLMSTLTEHSRIHSGQRNFECGSCDKKFTSSSALSRHKRTHLRNTDHCCEFCGTPFAHPGRLSMHIKSHLAAAGIHT